MAGAVGPAVLWSHFGANLEEHDPSVVLYRAQTARRTGNLQGNDRSHQSSSSPNPFRHSLDICDPDEVEPELGVPRVDNPYRFISGCDRTVVIGYVD
ncbi:hypothetical protein [Streptomyces lasalocidi]|uniref:Uncharacterized protein n=1 Tax=Streptomyces lasalocidi TaxID=324833 RepID=A0A4U5WHA0_STRLS|nr:hypothetical protein [Streptomyces lasalocidi]TKT01297.1 hypothetical protein E4U91_15005 [Streptomyces lasalocidi]